MHICFVHEKLQEFGKQQSSVPGVDIFKSTLLNFRKYFDLKVFKIVFKNVLFRNSLNFSPGKQMQPRSQNGSYKIITNKNEKHFKTQLLNSKNFPLTSLARDC